MPAEALAAAPGAVAVFLVLFARIGAVLMMLPAFSDDAVPARIRLIIALAITVSLQGMLSAHIQPLTLDSRALPFLVIAELMTGLAMGMIVRIMFQAAAMAGSVIALQIGLSSVLVPDASQGGQALLLSRLMVLAATVICLATGVHHLWIGAIVHSYSMFTPGELPPAADFMQLATTSVGNAMGLALSLAAPLIVFGIVFNVALGLASRLTPAIQVFFIAQPLNLMLGLGLFAMLFGTIMTTFAQSMAAWVATSGL